jgi:molybdopterin converting factor small subunit
MKIKVFFYSYFKDLAGCASVETTLSAGAKINDLLALIYAQFPKLAALSNSTLIAVGVEYQGRSYLLREGDEVSLFPPVQGG